MVSVGAIIPRGGTRTRGKNPPQGGAAHGARAHHRGAHNTAGGPRRQGAPHHGGHQHTGGALPPANTDSPSRIAMRRRDAMCFLFAFLLGESVRVYV